MGQFTYTQKIRHSRRDKIHKSRTDNHCPTGGLAQPNLPKRRRQFAEQPRNRGSVTFVKMRFDPICEANNIDHWRTKPNHLWTSGQVARMSRTIKDGVGVE